MTQEHVSIIASAMLGLSKETQKVTDIYNQIDDDEIKQHLKDINVSALMLSQRLQHYIKD